MQIIEKISSAVKDAQQENLLYQELYKNENFQNKKNDFIFFIKPEITVESDSIKLNEILKFMFNKISEFGFSIKNIKILSAQYLEKHNIIAEHYGVINKIARGATKEMSKGAFEKFESLYGKKVEDANVLGGFEFLAKYKDFNAYSLDYLWQNKENLKLSGGTYCEEIKLDAETVYLVNGFAPRQQLHFTDKGRSILVFSLSGDLSWKKARQEFVGATVPENALEGSLRRELLDRKEEFGIPEVSQGMNGVHLSAGAIEGLVEFIRYDSNLEENPNPKNFDEFSFGKDLSQHFSTEQIEQILSNSNVQYKGEVTSTYDLTEEMDSDDCLDILKSTIS